MEKPLRKETGMGPPLRGPFRGRARPRGPGALRAAPVGPHPWPLFLAALRNGGGMRGPIPAPARSPLRLRRCGGGVYRLRLIHGYRGGTAIRDMLWTVYNKRSQVKRLVSISEGVTELVLREY